MIKPTASLLWRHARSFAGLLYPDVCAGCGADILAGERFVCTHCLLDLAPAGYQGWTGHPVSALFEAVAPVEGAYARYRYHRGGVVQKLIYRVKYRGQRQLGIWLGERLGAALPSLPTSSDPAVLVPVPLHPSRLRQRGFNQSELICRGLSRTTGWFVETAALERVHGAASQTRRGRQDRWEQTEGVFRLRPGTGLAGRSVLLVDDVITTGATLRSCAGPLLDAGCRVYLVAVAVAADL